MAAGDEVVVLLEVAATRSQVNSSRTGERPTGAARAGGSAEPL